MTALARAAACGAALWLAACAAPPTLVRAHVAETARGHVPVVAFVDFECPFCRVAYARLHEAAARQHATLDVQHKYVALRMHPHAAEAAVAHLCADAQGRGEEAEKALYESPAEAHDAAHVLELARRLGLDEARFEACVTAPESKARLARDRRDLAELGHYGVPVTYVGTQLLDGLRSVDEYERAITRARKD